MWYKNLRPYRFTETVDFNAAQLRDRLVMLPFTHCGSHSEFSYGWTAPAGDDDFVVEIAGCYAICLQREEKLLPSSVVNEKLAEKIDEIEQQEMRFVGTKERTRIKEELIFEMLPRAFTHSKKTHAYIDTKNGWLIVDAANAKKAEDLLSVLRKTLGALKVEPLIVNQSVDFAMTQWINERPPKDLYLGDEVEIQTLESDGKIVKARRIDLALPEIKNHLATGGQVAKLALEYGENLSFVLAGDLQITRLRFLEFVTKQAHDVETETKRERFEADFAIMTAEIAELIKNLIKWFGD